MSKACHGPGPAGDGAAEVEVSGPRALANGYRLYERYELRLADGAGGTVAQTRDILRGGETVGVLPYDPGRDSVVLLRQFRLPAFLALGRERSELVEIVAGGVEAGEDPQASARRECLEEIGLAPRLLRPMLRVLPTPGITDECATLFLGVVDATRLPERAGLDAEAEVIRPFLVPVDQALELVAQGRCANGYLIIALQWLGLNRARLPELIAGR